MRRIINVSNELLAFLVVVGVLISIAGLFASFNSTGYSLITGAALANDTTETGTTSLSIAANLIIDLHDAAIDLGTLDLEQSYGSADNADTFGVTNNGSVDVDIYGYGAASSDSPFTSTTGGADTLPNGFYQFACVASDSGTCNTTYDDVPSTSSNKRLILDGLDTETDTATIGVNVTVPIDEVFGAKSAVLTIYAEEDV